MVVVLYPVTRLSWRIDGKRSPGFSVPAASRLRISSTTTLYRYDMSISILYHSRCGSLSRMQDRWSTVWTDALLASLFARGQRYRGKQAAFAVRKPVHIPVVPLEIDSFCTFLPTR